VQRTDVIPGTRERIVQTTTRLLLRQGYAGTGIKQIAREAEAALGSVYHFFPGGKQELAAEAIRHADREFAGRLAEALNGSDDPAEAIVGFVETIARQLRESDWLGSCSFTATALETVGSAPVVEQAIAEALEHWERLGADKLRGGGIAEADARDLASTFINALAGAELASMIARDDRPLLVAAHHLARLVNSYR
jgi:AcrR family transcriptional regulator